MAQRLAPNVQWRRYVAMFLFVWVLALLRGVGFEVWIKGDVSSRFDLSIMVQKKKTTTIRIQQK